MNINDAREYTKVPSSGKLRLLVCALIITVILIISYFPIKLFFIGSARCEMVNVTSSSVTDDNISIVGDTSSSAEAFRSYSYKKDNENVYITVKYVLPSKSFNSSAFHINIDGDFSGISRIYLKGDTSDKLVWTK